MVKSRLDPSNATIGYFVDDHGSGSVTRAGQIARHLRARVIGFSGLACPKQWPGEWVQLPADATDAPDDPTAGGVLRWAPLRHAGYRARMAALGERLSGLDVVVADASVEVTLLARLYGVPTVVVARRGTRGDRPHELAHEAATALLAPWAREYPVTWWPGCWTDKTWFVGAISRFDDAEPVTGTAHHEEPRVLVVLGAGGHDLHEDALFRARVATPGWEWVLRSAEMASPDLWRDLGQADVVVCHGGNNAVAEVAAARRPAVIVAQEQPFSEQQHIARALDSAGVCVGLPRWPDPEQWPALLQRALDCGGSAWDTWNPRNGARHAAMLLDDLAIGSAGIVRI